MGKRFTSIFAGALSVSCVAFGQGTFTYDQQSSTTNGVGSGGAYLQGQQPMGQSFTPSLSQVGFVQFEFSDGGLGSGLGGTVYVNLLADAITGTALSTSGMVTVPDNVVNSVATFLFPSLVSVTPGTTYYFQPILASGNTQLGITADYFNYPGGSAYFNGVPGSTDFWFREGVVPEPSSASLILAGLGAFFCVRRFVRRGR